MGASFADYHAASPVLDVAITPNRPDCMGVLGLARDLAAAGVGTFKPFAVPEIAAYGPCPVEIRIDDPEGCPAFYGRTIQGVTNGASPEWMQRRLIAAGQRPISALVDITNYVMLAFGRPAHVYDLARLSGAVVARRAKQGEQVLALNDKSYTLDDTMTVIADASAVQKSPGSWAANIRALPPKPPTYCSRSLLRSTRIGVTAAGRPPSDARTRSSAASIPPPRRWPGDPDDMILRICGGTASESVRTDRRGGAESIAFDPALTQRLGGVEYDHGEQRRILAALDLPYR